MHEIECILHEYLSFNWDRVEEIFDANSVYLSEDGLKCPWYSNGHLPVGACLISPSLLPPLLICGRRPNGVTVFPGLAMMTYSSTQVQLSTQFQKSEMNRSWLLDGLTRPERTQPVST